MPLLALQDQDALAVQHEEVLLHRLGVVAAVGLARLEDLDVDAGIRPAYALGLQLDDRRAPRVAARGRVRQVHHERLVHRAAHHTCRDEREAPRIGCAPWISWWPQTTCTAAASTTRTRRSRGPARRCSRSTPSG